MPMPWYGGWTSHPLVRNYQDSYQTHQKALWCTRGSSVNANGAEDWNGRITAGSRHDGAEWEGLCHELRAEDGIFHPFFGCFLGPNKGEFQELRGEIHVNLPCGGVLLGELAKYLTWSFQLTSGYKYGGVRSLFWYNLIEHPNWWVSSHLNFE